MITAGILLSGVVITAFDRIKAPGVAACLALGIVLVFIIINDVSVWHIVPLIVIGIVAEIIRFVAKYNLRNFNHSFCFIGGFVTFFTKDLDHI